MSSRKVSVEDRILQALALAKADMAPSQISVSAICRMAGVNRANLYAHYPHLVATLRELHPKKVVVVKELRQDSGRSRQKQYAALLYLCLELNAEAVALRGQLSGQRKQLRK